jgi:hypothetical protein
MIFSLSTIAPESVCLPLGGGVEQPGKDVKLIRANPDAIAGSSRQPDETDFGCFLYINFIFFLRFIRGFDITSTGGLFEHVVYVLIHLAVGGVVIIGYIKDCGSSELEASSCLFNLCL